MSIDQVIVLATELRTQYRDFDELVRQALAMSRMTHHTVIGDNDVTVLAQTSVIAGFAMSFMASSSPMGDLADMQRHIIDRHERYIRGAITSDDSYNLVKAGILFGHYYGHNLRTAGRR